MIFFTFSQKDKSWSINLKSILQELDKLVVIGKDGEERREEEEREEDQGGKGGKGGEMADHRNFLGSIFGQNLRAKANHPSSCHFFACPPWSSTFSLFNFPLLRNWKLNPLWHYATSQAMRCIIAWLHDCIIGSSLLLSRPCCSVVLQFLHPSFVSIFSETDFFSLQLRHHRYKKKECGAVQVFTESPRIFSADWRETRLGITWDLKIFSKSSVNVILILLALVVTSSLLFLRYKAWSRFVSHSGPL